MQKIIKIKILMQAYKDKILVLFITLTFVFTGYVLGISQPKISQIHITLRNPSPLLFEIYNSQQSNNLTYAKRTDIVSQFSYEFELNLLSTKNQIYFFEQDNKEQNNKFDNFKSFLKDKNTSTEIYFHEKLSLRSDQKKNINNRYIFTFEKPFPGDQYLVDYITFVKKKQSY
jgi:LPS O-antigen subunit length determinant protein (WzzB/FepE family)